MENAIKLSLSSTTKSALLPVYIASGFSAALFILGPFFISKGPHRGLIICCLMLSVFSMWLFWLIIYVAQMNPLVGPRMDNTTLAWVGYCWGVDPKTLT